MNKRKIFTFAIVAFFVCVAWAGIIGMHYYSDAENAVLRPSYNTPPTVGGHGFGLLLGVASIIACAIAMHEASE